MFSSLFQPIPTTKGESDEDWENVRLQEDVRTIVFRRKEHKTNHRKEKLYFFWSLLRTSSGHFCVWCHVVFAGCLSKFCDEDFQRSMQAAIVERISTKTIKVSWYLRCYHLVRLSEKYLSDLWNCGLWGVQIEWVLVNVEPQLSWIFFFSLWDHHLRPLLSDDHTMQQQATSS